jgi:hypothetical protein
VPHQIKIFPHNDLFNLAHYHREIIRNKIASHNEEGLTLDCMSFIIATAFGIEAFINFLGSQVVDEWKERQPFKSKLDQIYGSVGEGFDKNCEPYKTVWSIKETRDSIAHGKPYEDTVKIRSTDELWLEMSAPWDNYLDSDYVEHVYEQVNNWVSELLKIANIPIESTLTSAKHVP